MLKQSTALLSVFFLWLLLLAMPALAYYDGDDLGYLDYVTINDQEFENFDERQIVFYPEDLRDGAVIIRGLLEAEKKHIPVTDLHVEITLNGGKSWQAADGNSRWEYKFYPDIERGYDFSIRVVENSISDLPPGSFDPAGELWKIGEFELRTAAKVQLEKLSGKGSIALGWLNSYLPERLRDPGTQDLEVEFENLQTEAGKIIGGEIRVAVKNTIQLPWAELEIHKIFFSATGARLTGSINVNFEGLTFPDLPLDSIALSLSGLSGDFSVADVDNPFHLVLFEGDFGATLLLNNLVLGVDTEQQVPLFAEALSGSMQLGPGYGGLQVPNLALLADRSIGWGRAVVAQGQEFVGAGLTIPNTNFKLRDIGGSINLGTKSLSLSGKFQFPDELGGGSVRLPAETPLYLSASGISTSGTLQFDAGSLPALDLSGFPTSLSELSLAIADNIPSGRLAGQVVLTNFASLPLDISADIGKDGLDRLRMATEKETYSFNLADFATLSLSKLALEYGAGDFSVDLDGSITPTSDLVSSISGIGESIAFTGLTIANNAITLASDLAGWHGLNGASAQIEQAVLTLSEYGIGVEDNKFWVGLKGSGTLAGATVNATARIFHDGTSEISGMELQRLHLAYGGFLLKLDRSAVDVDGLVSDATEAVIAGLPQIVMTNFPTLFNDNNELPVQLNGFNVDLINKKVTLGSVTINPRSPLAFNLGPVAMQLTGMTLSTGGAEIDGSLSLEELGLTAENIPFAGLSIGSTGFAGEIDLAGLSGVRQISLLDGEYGFGLNLSELRVAINSQLPAAQMVKLAGLAGSLQFGSGYGNVQVPNLSLLADNAIAWGKTVVAEGETLAAEGEAIAGAILTIPGTEFKLADIGGAINLENLSLSLSGQFLFPENLGGGSVSLPATTPLVLSRKGISTSGTLQFDAGNLPSLDLSGFPTSLSALSLAIADNIPSGSFSGQVLLTSFANLPLDISADLNKDGLRSLQLAVEKETYNYTLDDFATLSLTKLALKYDDGDFSVELDGSIVPKNDLLLSLTGIGEKLVFSGLTITQDAITLASELDGWHPISGGSAGFSGATVSLSEYGLGVENNLFWVGLKGQASLGGSSATATARIFHDGTTSVDGIDLSNLYFALGDFFLKVSADDIDEAGAVASSTLGAIGGLPQVLIDSLPNGILNDAQELIVQLNNFHVDLANRSVTLGSVGYIPATPFDVTLGPVSLSFAGINFTTSSASIDGSINLTGIGLPVSDLSFSDLHLGQLGFNGEVDLVGSLGTLSVDILSGEYGFGLDLNELRVAINTRNSPATMVQLTAFGGSLRFGTGFGSLTIPDLSLLDDQSIRWGKNLAAGVDAAGHRLVLPGNLFSISELGGSINLAEKMLTLSGDIHLPPALGSARVSIPADKPLTISAANGLSSGGDLVFPTADLPSITLAHIDSQLTALTLGISNGSIRGAIGGELIFDQFGGLRIAVRADIDSGGINDLTIDSGALNRTFNLDGFAILKLEKVSSGYYDHHFYVQVDGSLQATHPLFEDYAKKVKLNGLRIFKNSIAFVSDMSGWKPLKGASIDINAAELALREYGLGVENGQLWFGLKGQASYQNNSFDLTARIFQDKHYEISDFNFDGLTLSLGDFSLRTAAELADGVMSGEGYINAGFLTEFIPASMKDPVTGELVVSFSNLGVDLDAKSVTSGDVTINFPRGMTVTLPAVQAVLRSISFGTSGASVDGDIALSSVGGIDLPNALTNLSFGDISLTPAGLLGALSWPSVANNAASKVTKGSKRGVSAVTAGARGPLSIPVVTGEYGLTLKLTSVDLDLDTTKSSILDMVKLTDLDGSIELGSGYNLDQTVTNLRMLANGAITWGVEQTNQAARLGSKAGNLGEQTAADMKEAARNAAASGFSFTIPGTTFAVRNLTGRLYLADRQVELWGGIKLPTELGGGSFSLRQENSLLLSSSGISTQGPVDIDLGSLSGFKLGGFGAKLSELSLEISSNSISGSVAGEIKLSAFDNILIAVDGSFNGSGIREINVATDRLERTFTMSNFAALTLADVEGGYGDDGFYINIDGNLALENSQVGELPMTFDFDDLKVFSDGLSLGDVALPMHGVDDVSVTLNGDLLMSLNEYGFGVTDNRFWIALAGGVTYDEQSLTATAKVYHDGEFSLPQLSGDNLLIAVGDFTLRTSFDFSGGTITEAEGSLHLGSLMTSIPDELKNPLGELPVTIRNVDVDLSDLSAPKIHSGAIAFNTAFPLVNDFFTAQIDGIEVGAVGGTAYGKVLGGSIAFKQAGSLPMLSGISLTNIGLTSSGFSGTLAWSGDQDIPVFEDDNYGITANLTAVSLALDSSKATFDEIVRLTTLDGSVAFGAGYGTALVPALDYVDGAYSFATGLDTSINIPGTAMALKAFSGALDFNAASVGFGGLISIPYEQTEVAFDVDSLTFSASGVDGSIELTNPVEIGGLGFPTVLTDAGLSFQGFALSSGHLGLDLTLEQFLDLEVSAKLALNSDGISAWSLGGETDQTFSADAGFAELKVKDLGAGYDSNDGLFFTMNPEIKMKEDAILSALPDDIKLSGLEVYSDHIDIDAATMGGSIDNATVGVAGVDLTLTHLALGYESGEEGAAGEFNLVVGGGIALGDLLSADAVVTIYKNSFTLNDIEIDYSNPGFSLYGNLVIAESRFMADLAVQIAGTINMQAMLEAGSSVSGDDVAFSYWRVALMADATINLSPLPMNIYGIGGGLAYHQTVSVNESNEPVFTPDIGTSIAVTANVNLGTLDQGYTYFGKFSLTLEPTNFRMLLTGDSWFMKGKDNASGDPHLFGSLELGASPAMVQIIVQAKLEKEMAGMTLLGVGGEVDLLFSESDWHIYFGSAQRSLDVTLLEFLTGSGYIQLDSSGIAMGVRYEFDLEGKAWIFYGRVYGGAQIDLEAGIKPFYIDARGKIWIGLEAGVKARGRKFEIISAYAELGGQFKAPPVYIGLHGKARYSFLMGLVKGTWEMTFTMPKNPPEGAGDSSIENMPLIAYSSPENGATEVGRLESVMIRANMPIMKPFKYDDHKWYILCVKDPDHPNDIVDFTEVKESITKTIDLRSANGMVEVVGGRQGQMDLNFTPVMQLSENRNYNYTTTFQLRRYDQGTIGAVVSSEEVHAAFTTTDQPIGFRERIYDVYPRRSTTPVYGETEIYIVTKALFDGYAWNWMLNDERLSFEVVNAAGEAIPGQINGKQMVTDGEQGTRRYLLKFEPEQPLKAVRMVESSAGVKRAAIYYNGRYLNPFKYTAPPEEEAESSVSSQATAIGTPSAIGGVSGTVDRAKAAGVTRVSASRATISAGSTVRTPAVGSSALVASTGLDGATVIDSQIDHSLLAEDQETYRWYWDGEYKIQIVDGEGVKKYTSKFVLVTPEQGEDEPQFASTSDVVEAGISNAHFNMSYNLDQDAYKADVQRGREQIVVDGINALWPAFQNSAYRQLGTSCRYANPQDIDAVNALLNGMAPASWEQLNIFDEVTLAMLRSAAMEQCAPLKSQIDVINQQFDEYRDAAFERNPSSAFRAVEFKFSTDAPINWSEIDMRVGVHPEFSSQLTIMGVSMNPGATTRHTFKRGEWFVRSQPDGLDHVLELKPKVKAHYDGDLFLKMIHEHADRNSYLETFGFAIFSRRSLQEGNSEMDSYSGEYDLTEGETLLNTGMINELTPRELLGR